jgi:hypothetical protein
LCHAHIICITVRENIIICCQIFCDLLLKSAFERWNKRCDIRKFITLDILIQLSYALVHICSSKY